MKIKKLKTKYKIELDNKPSIITYEDIILKYNILYKKDLSDDLIDKILKENLFYDAFYSCTSYILKRLRSEFEVKKYLDKFPLFQEEKDNVIKKLKELDLINDYNLTSAFINDKINFTNYGPYKIKADLKKIRIDENIIMDLLNKVDSKIYYDKINQIILKKLKTNSSYSGNVMKQKLFVDLTYLGYSKDMIYDVLSNLQVNSNIDMIYDKVYKKYSKKYDGYILTMKIKEKLLSFGFKEEEINKKITF